VGELFPNFVLEDRRIHGLRIRLRRGGTGPPLLLLHGYPQTHVMWHAVAGPLATHFELICPDLRGYGDTDKPRSGPRFEEYSKRSLARDAVELMHDLGHERFHLAGHDRGGRVVHRLVRDWPDRVARACVMDIAPTLTMFEQTDQAFALAYYHWFFLSQPPELPERLLAADPEYFLQNVLRRWSAPGAYLDPRAVAEYSRCFSREMIRASCDDYRAAAGIDLDHDRADRARRIGCPLLVLWGRDGFVGRRYNVLETWRESFDHVQGRAIPGGHFIAEEAPEEVCQEVQNFFGSC